jgi:ABC-type glutathione transport system ATPase component
MGALVSIRDLRVEFDTDRGSIVGVDDVSFAINPGETVCVVGESGSGKSVTSLSLMRLVEFGGGKISKGELEFARADGTELDLAKAGPQVMQDIRGNEIGMIFQEPMTALNPVFTIERQLIDGLMRHRQLTLEAARKRVLELLRSVRIPEPERRLKQYPHELSGGMRQRVVIAMAMACEPRLLIADEPTTALDVTIQAEILALINRLKTENGMAVLFITHDMAVVAQMADRVVVMYQGKIVESGSVDQIFASPREDYTKALLAAVPKLGEMRGKTHPERMRLIDDAPPAPATKANTESRRVLLDVKNLVARFPVKGGALRRTVAQVHAVEDVSFSLKVGETLGLVGESGCGKSTCGRALLRLIEPSSGGITLDGVDVRSLDRTALRQARHMMQMVFQDPFASLNPYRRLRDQVAEPITNFAPATSVPEVTARVEALFDRVRLPRDFLRRFPHELSGGQRQRVAIARALAPSPKLIVADEAVSALDVSVQASVLNLMMELQEELGVSYVFISHDMAVVERISHQVGVMYLGRIVEIGPRAAVLENPSHPYTKSLLAAVPVADPRRRQFNEDRSHKPIRSPIFPMGHQPRPSIYDEVEPGHLVLRD